MKIIAYSDEYAQKIIKHIRDIAINEFKYNDWEEYFNKMSFDEYKLGSNKFLMALNDFDEVIGTIGALKRTDEEVYLNSLYVNKEYRNQGLAKKLYDEVLTFIREDDYKLVTLRTFFRFELAIRFYEKLGFERYDEDEESYFYKKYL